jgi:hypothetical protein
MTANDRNGMTTIKWTQNNNNTRIFHSANPKSQKEIGQAERKQRRPKKKKKTTSKMMMGSEK